MKKGAINYEIKVNSKKALTQIEDIKIKLIEISDLMQQIQGAEINISVEVIKSDKKWYQFWK